MHINYPTVEQIEDLKAAGYKIICFENVGMGEMERCEEGTYNEPDFLQIDEENEKHKEAILCFL